ncbi:hypothetical protein [Bacillus sp. MRMR6]|uniref:hypothetical protein n=1 Tax=Bacillus sp. MRMR6 TaxID=1928617 RepID=UPI000951BA70|nr:hypothetical protein [Bacillus sp. MRMR6]OLS36162.1 hypothetical protein BTR25_18105 [Bacillus sp. MRMR6]
MKKIFTLLFSSLVVLLIFGSVGNPVKASEIPEGEENCICHDVTFITGAEKNKIVANLLKTDALKDVRKEQKAEGIKWNGVNDVQVLKHNVYPVTIVGIPVTFEDGTALMATFINGEFMGVGPR